MRLPIPKSTLRRLHRVIEPDKVDTHIIIYVPLILLVCFLLTWLTVTWIINYIRSPSTEKPKNQMAAVRQAEPINERLGRINSSTPLAEVKQPRLDGLNRLKNEGEPVYVRSSRQPKTAIRRNIILKTFARPRKSARNWDSRAIPGSRRMNLPASLCKTLKMVLKAKNPKSPSGSFIAIQQKDGKPVQLADLLKSGPTAANPQAHTSPKEPGPVLRMVITGPSMNKYVGVLLLVFLALPVFGQNVMNYGKAPAAPSREPKELLPTVKIEQRLGEQIPLDLVFHDEHDNEITLGSCVGGKPTILVIAYYRCPMLCSAVLRGVVEAARALPGNIGEDFNIVTVGSIRKIITSSLDIQRKLLSKNTAGRS